MTISDYVQRFVDLRSATDRLAIEATTGRAGYFTELDGRVTPVVDQLATGAQLFDVAWESDGIKTVGDHLVEIDWLREHLAVGSLKAAGAWHLPSTVEVRVGLIQFAWIADHWPDHPLRVMANTRRRVPLDSPWAPVIWATLEPLFERLWDPLRRGIGDAGIMEQAQAQAAWTSDCETFDQLGIDSLILLPLKPRWPIRGRSFAELADAADAVIDAVTAAPGLWQRWRVTALGFLMNRYVGQAARTGHTTQRRMVSGSGGSAAARLLVALFGGSWLSFLTYIEADPDPREQIATAVPSSRLRVADRGKITAVAQAAGISAADVEAMIAAQLGVTDPFPIQRRLDALHRLWQWMDGYLDEAQRTEVAMHLGDHAEYDGSTFVGAAPHLPGAIESDVLGLWGTVASEREPTLVLTNGGPLMTALSAVGPASDMWLWLANVVAMSSDERFGAGEGITGVASQLDRVLREAEAVLTEYGTPAGLDDLIFDLSLIEREQAAAQDRVRTLSDRLTAARRAWTDRYFAAYLESRWQRDLTARADRYHVLAVRRGKPPTFKSFATGARGCANKWLGGDLGALYGVLGEPLPPKVQIAHRALLPHQPRHELKAAVLERLQSSSTQRLADAGELRFLAASSPRYLTLREELDRPLEPEEVAAAIHEDWRLLARDPISARRRYIDAIEDVIACAATVGCDEPTGA